MPTKVTRMVKLFGIKNSYLNDGSDVDIKLNTAVARETPKMYIFDGGVRVQKSENGVAMDDDGVEWFPSQVAAKKELMSRLLSERQCAEETLKCLNEKIALLESDLAYE